MTELFWSLTALLGVGALAFVSWPLWRQRERGAAIALAVVLLVGAGALYWRLGNHDWQRGADARDTARLTGLLQAAQRNPNEIDGWLRLAQAYATAEQFPAALNAYQRANSLAGGRSAQALSGMGEVLLRSGDTSRISQAVALLDQALDVDPKNARALFYTAVYAAQSGDLQLARTRFATMLTLDVPDNIRDSLTKEISNLDAQLSKSVDQPTAIRLQIELAPALANQVPAGASLFVFVQAPGGGAPLAVKRLDASLPRQLVLSAADSMIESNRLKPGQKVHVVARISASGQPTATAGDLYGELDAVAGQGGEQLLRIAATNQGGT
ncbi:MAG TPA: hypothetical protein VMI92_01265 [Steroidobacteraceae bacterium]|nr:hypothetical protein [Steroidobacteraceae bacterium]